MVELDSSNDMRELNVTGVPNEQECGWIVRNSSREFRTRTLSRWMRVSQWRPGF